MTLNVLAIMEQMKRMSSLELYSSLAVTSDLAISMANNCRDLFTAVNLCEMYKYHADCLFENNEYKKAETKYIKALRLYKSVPKSKSKQTLMNLQQMPFDVEIKFKVYQCYMFLKNDYEALNILEGIPQKHRSAKIHLALAKLYQKLGIEKSAIACYKEVLRTCPLALDCAIELLRLGEHLNIVISICNTDCGIDWLEPYMKAHSIQMSKDFSKSVFAFEALSKKPSLLGNSHLLCALGKSFYNAGNSFNALQCFKTAHLQDPLWLDGMDLYSYLLCEDEQVEELEKFSSKIFSVSELHPEPWIALGYYSKLKGDFTKAVYLATRATEIDVTCVQAFLLKGVCLRLLGEVKVAITHFRQAMVLAPSRLDCYVELVTCYIQERRHNEALNIAKSALDSVGYSSDSFALCAASLLPDDSSHDQAIRMADRALSINPNHKHAIEIRCKIARRQEKFADAIKLLKGAVQSHGNSVFHTMLADCYFKTSKYSDAVDHYNIAMSLNPNSKEAKEGLDKIQALDHNNPSDGDAHEEITSSGNGETAAITGSVSWPHDDWF